MIKDGKLQSMSGHHEGKELSTGTRVPDRLQATWCNVTDPRHDRPQTCVSLWIPGVVKAAMARSSALSSAPLLDETWLQGYQALSNGPPSDACLDHRRPGQTTR